MLINPISIYSTENKRCYGTKNAKCNKSNTNFCRKNQCSLSNISFNGKPWALPKIKKIDFYSAVALYSYLRIGQYLDSSDDDIDLSNKIIRENNLSFLDNLTTQEDKKKFIDYYSDLTGFPDLKCVSEKIEREFIVGITKSCAEVYGAECIVAGYDETCSVGKRKAFPGSDLDKSFVVLKSPNMDLNEDEYIVNNFKSKLWENIDQRILSFNHDISFPSVYTDNQLYNLLNKIQNKTSYMQIDEEKLNKLMNEEFVNLERAAEYNIAVSKYFPVEAAYGELSKEDVKNLGYVTEAIREGRWVISSPTGDYMKRKLENYEFYNYSNVAQMRAMTKAVNEGRENKTKILLRNNFEQKFNSWDVDKQLKFIKTLIQYSCEDNSSFSEYFTNDRNVKDAYKPLLNMLTQGDSQVYNRPEFTPIENGLNLKYAEDASVNLYQGYNNSVLWIDSSQQMAIKQACRMINKIRQLDLFKNVSKVQCPKPDVNITNFYPIGFYTKDGTIIYERMI